MDTLEETVFAFPQRKVYIPRAFGLCCRLRVHSHEELYSLWTSRMTRDAIVVALGWWRANHNNTDPILDKKKGDGEIVKDPTVFEWYAAIATDTLPWKFIPAEIKHKRHIEVKDVGIDSASNRIAVQTKNYQRGSLVSFEDCSRFESSYRLWNARRKIIVTPPDVRVCPLERYSKVEQIVLDQASIDKLHTFIDREYRRIAMWCGEDIVERIARRMLEGQDECGGGVGVTNKILSTINEAQAKKKTIKIFVDSPSEHRQMADMYSEDLVAMVTSRTKKERFGEVFDVGVLYNIDRPDVLKIAKSLCGRAVIISS